MGAAYQIFGRTFLPHQLALGTIGLVGLIIAFPKGKKSSAPLLNASSPEEEKFILDYIRKKESKPSCCCS